MTAEINASLGDPVRATVQATPGGHVSGALAANAPGSVSAQVGAAVSGSVSAAIQAALGQSLSAEVEARVIGGGLGCDAVIGFDPFYDLVWDFDTESPYYLAYAATICQLSYRTFTKNTNEPCYCAYYAKDNGYTGPILVGKTKSSAEFSPCDGEATSFEYEGETWWVSPPAYFMPGNLTSSAGVSPKLSPNQMTHEAARDILVAYGATRRYVRREIEKNLSNWSFSLSSATFENVYEDGVNTVKFVGSAGYEYLTYTEQGLERLTEYCLTFKFCAPSGYRDYDQSHALNRPMRAYCGSGSTVKFKSEASSVPEEYWLVANTGAGTSLTFTIDFSGIADYEEFQFIFSDFKILKFSKMEVAT